MSVIDSFLNLFGIHRMPWVIRAFLLLLAVFVGLLIFAVYRTPEGLPDNSNHPAIKLFAIAADSLKIVVGAIIGSLSLAAERTWGNKTPPPQQLEP